MLPMIRQGKDTVTISPIKNELKRFDIALYTRKNGKHILHRIVKTGETYTCIGDNQYEYETGLKDEQFIGVVTSFSRNGKDRSVADKGYMLYCRIWHHSRKIRYFVYRVVRKLSGMLKNGRKLK